MHAGAQGFAGKWVHAGDGSGGEGLEAVAWPTAAPWGGSPGFMQGSQRRRFSRFLPNVRKIVKIKLFNYTKNISSQTRKRRERKIKASHLYNTENISFVFVNHAPQINKTRRWLVFFMHKLLHTPSGRRRIQWATACRRGWWEGNKGDKPFLLLHFDEEESGSQASQGKNRLKCSTGIMHVGAARVLSLPAGERHSPSDREKRRTKEEPCNCFSPTAALKERFWRQQRVSRDWWLAAR